jgi:uncharacterized protein
MKTTSTNARSAFWIVITAALLTFTTHAVQGARSINNTPKTSVKPIAKANAQLSSMDPLLTAAYRDGLYVGKLVAQRGEQHLAPVGRWATQSDRDAFLAGYEQSNAEIAQASSGN